MAVGTLTLSDFLLARIAEDEARVQQGWRDAHLGDCAAADLDYPMPCDCGHPARVLAECEAKRQIVETWQRLENEDTTGFVVGGGWDPGIGYASDALELAMCALAAVYADHPDYNPEWCP